MRRRLYLMRHAHVSYVGEHDPEVVRLTARGREQAAAVAAALAGVELDAVFSSSLPRTVETAQIVAPGWSPVAWPEFAEWRGGSLEEIEPPQLEQLFLGGLQAGGEAHRFLGGESLGELFDRVLPAFERLVASEWQTALAVFHGGVNRVLLSHALAGGRSYFGRFEQAPACLNVLDLGPDGWVVRTINYVAYDALHPSRSTTMEDVWAELVAGAAAKTDE
jgi:broad specificity phosphatase PhoE